MHFSKPLYSFSILIVHFFRKHLSRIIKPDGPMHSVLGNSTLHNPLTHLLPNTNTKMGFLPPPVNMLHRPPPCCLEGGKTHSFSPALPISGKSANVAMIFTSILFAFLTLVTAASCRKKKKYSNLWAGLRSEIPALSEDYGPLLCLTCWVMEPEPQPVASEHVNIYVMCVSI